MAQPGRHGRAGAGRGRARRPPGDRGAHPATRRAPRPGPGVPDGPAGTPASSFGIWDWARWGWRQLTSMRTALVLLFLLALAQRARVGAAAAGHRPAGGAAVLRRAPVAGAAAGPAVAVQRVRRALVRRDLPAAVRLARGLRDPAHVPAGRLGAAAAAAGTAPTWPGCRSRPATRPRSPRTRRSPRRRRCCRPSGSGCAPATAGCRRKRATCGKPGTCCSTWRCSRCSPRSALGGMFGYKANRLLVVGDSFANTATDLDAFHPGRAVSAARPAAVHDRARLVPGVLRHLGRPARAAVAVRRAHPLLAAARGRDARLQPAGESPAERGRRAGVPDRPRLRAGVPGHRRDRPGGLRRPGAVHRRGAGRASPPKA